MNASVVVRVGGTNSGHTIVTDEGQRMVFRILPVASVLEGVTCVLPSGSYIDINVLKKEVQLSGIRKDLLKILKQISPNLRYINNKNIQILNKIAFCAGSGADFISEAQKNGADAFVTGDLKFHTALDSSIVIYDIGHFESEIFVLSIFEKLLHNDVEIIYADEASPFKYN